MADAIDSKSIEGNLMRVRVSPAAPIGRNINTVRPAHLDAERGKNED